MDSWKANTKRMQSTYSDKYPRRREPCPDDTNTYPCPPEIETVSKTHQI